jgi:hypothetical protein
MNIAENPLNFKKKEKSFNDKFLKQLIDSDFVFSKSHTTKENLKMFNSSIKYQNKDQFHILNIFRLNTSLKQFIRLLQFLTKNKPFIIYILCENFYYLRLTKKLVKKLGIQDYFYISSTYPQYGGDPTKLKLVFFLGDIEMSNNFFLKLDEEETFLIMKYNLKVEKKLFGMYKIQNELDDYKKLVLLLIIMKKVIKE